MTARTIYRGTPPAARIAAAIEEGRRAELEAMERERRRWRSCPMRTGPLATLCPDGLDDCATHCQQMRARGLYDDGQPMPRKKRPVCGAKTRAGGECRVKVEPGKERCRFHGGKSTGPKTQEGRARIAEAQRRRWQAFRDEKATAKADAKEAKRQARIAAML